MAVDQNDERIKVARELAAREEQIVINAFHRVFKSEDGVTVREFLVEFFGLENPAFQQDNNGRFDELKAAYRDGQRSIIIQINRMLKRPCQGDANVQSKPKVIR